MNDGKSIGSAMGVELQAYSLELDSLDRRSTEQIATVELTDHNLRSITNVVESEIIPRLILIHAGTEQLKSKPATGRGRLATDEDVSQLNRLLLENRLRDASALATKWVRDGMSYEELFLGVFASCARQLGRLWETDDLSFIDVTVALTGLRGLLGQFDGPSHHDGAGARAPALRRQRRALLLATPGDQHTFGLTMVTSIFRSRGWSVTGGCELPKREMRRVASTQAFDIVGFSISRSALIPAAAEAIRDCKAACSSNKTRFIVGGGAVEENPDLCQSVGADAAVESAIDAVEVAEGLLI